MPNTNANLEVQMDEVRTDMKEIRSSVSKIAEAMTKLAVLEEKNHMVGVTMEKLCLRMDRMEERHREDGVVREQVLRNALRLDNVETKAGKTEIEQVKFAAEITGITKTMKLMWTAFGGGVLYLGSQAFHFLMSLPKP